MRELLKLEASKQKKNECLELVPRWRAQQRHVAATSVLGDVTRLHLVRHQH
jgi:hypothetical protein